MFKLNLTAPINKLGYGVAGLNIAVALFELEDTQISLFPIPNRWRMECDPEYMDVLRILIANADVAYDKNADSLRIWHQNELAQHVGKGRHIAFPFWELDRFTDVELHQLKQQDIIFATSEWGVELLQKHGVEVCTAVVPLGVDLHTFFPSDMPTGEKTVFLNIGKWEVRKGHDFLLQAFNRAFKPTDQVELWMMNHNPFLEPDSNQGVDGNAEWCNYYRQNPNVKILPRVETHEGVANIMRRADCGVFPSRGEGWNLEALEMLACGKHLIITDYSAHREFANCDNAFLIPVDGTEPAFDGKWFFRQGEWAKLGDDAMEATVAHMKRVHAMKQNGENMLNDEGVATTKSLTWRDTAKLIKEILE